jgi:type I site-specific restriction endonuclease
MGVRGPLNMSPAGSKNAPEAKAREKIDALLAQVGWLVQDREEMNLTASDGTAVREFKLEKGHGYVDYLLFVDGNALGVVEAKPAGYSFTSVEFQAKKYVEGLPASLTAPQKPLPFEPLDRIRRGLMAPHNRQLLHLQFRTNSGALGSSSSSGSGSRP